MRRKLFRISVAASMGLLMQGCSTLWSVGTVEATVAEDGRCDSMEVVLPGPLGRSGAESAAETEVVHVSEGGRLSPAYISAIVRGDATVDPLLDCVLVPVATEESRLYRGHVVVSLLATYGAYNFEVGAYEERIGDAVNFLVTMRKAEAALRAASDVVGANADAAAFDAHQRRLEQVLLVLETALYAERPTLRRVDDKVRSLVGAINAGVSTGLVRGAAESAVDGLKKSIRLRHFGRAYLLDAADDLGRFSVGGSPTAADWQVRDRVIESACRRVAAIADLETFSCVPGD
ncbi:MAG: hypothetical protein H6959_01850 [Chromatiaceae bacterium]|nr:hypothetical protein [Gammaproteobacteria bacterium]MCP5300887.1 hypothetical protein [Chromatiaceae bacterium]MCP5421640.1 hypothetical protein [Chromatiaceae bacterium]